MDHNQQTASETQQIIEALRKEVQVLRKALELALPGYLEVAEAGHS